MTQMSPYDTTRPEFQTPMMIQYMQLKDRFPDCILFFRLGDFYEMFLDDAKVGSKILGITLTRRSRGKDGAIPMAGVPYHAVDMYLPKLVDAGYKVAIAEQITAPKDSPHLVEREVVRIVTQGTMIEGRAVNHKESSFVCVIVKQLKEYALAYADLATGEFFVRTSKASKLADDLHQIAPKEIIISPEEYHSPVFLGTLRSSTQMNINTFSEWDHWQQRAHDVLTQQLKVSTLLGFGLDSPIIVQACGVLYGYLSYTQHGQLAHISAIRRLLPHEYLNLDATTVESLELLSSSMDKKVEGSLLNAIDQTLTPMGARLLKRWLLAPLTNQKEIQQRLNQVEWAVNSPQSTNTYRDLFAQITDIERQLSKLAVGIGNARDLVELRNNLQVIETISKLPEHAFLEKYFHPLKNLSTDVIRYLEQWIDDDPPGITKVGGMIKKGAHAQLDHYRTVLQDAELWIKTFEATEKTRTGINMLKVGFNSVFGYYIEISNAQAHTVQASFGYERRQTLVNAERFITPELKIQEEKVLTARSKADDLEHELFLLVVDHVLQHTVAIQQLAQNIANLDCIFCFAHIALTQNYTKPQITNERILSISNGRHPVVEKYLHDQFVPNSTEMDQDKRMMLLTGPNMAGKSTYIRQVALIVLLAHIGSFVPADSAIIPLSDRIFSRIGASDALHKGLSTFMVEMTETARILHHMSDRSLVIFDEIGRGTGISDGMSIAQAIAEHVAIMPQYPFVFFATHYHELADLAQEYPSIINASMAVQIHKQKMIFLRTLQQGSTIDSFGVEVAQQAGLPIHIIKRAQQLREAHKHFTKKSETTQNSETISEEIVIRAITSLELDQITPKAAQEFLYSIQKKLLK